MQFSVALCQLCLIESSRLVDDKQLRDESGPGQSKSVFSNSEVGCGDSCCPICLHATSCRRRPWQDVLTLAGFNVGALVLPDGTSYSDANCLAGQIRAFWPVVGTEPLSLFLGWQLFAKGKCVMVHGYVTGESCGMRVR